MTKKILIADDDDNIRELVRVSLETGGYELHEATDGVQALDMALKLQPDLIVLDIMMPGKVGYEVCAEVKKNPETRHTRIILLSARGKPISLQTGQALGADAYLSKPFNPEELERTVKKLLGETLA